MILFVVDQIAGAEYIYPLLLNWQQRGKKDWVVCASPVAASFFHSHNIPHNVIYQVNSNNIDELIERISPWRALLSASVDSLLEQTFIRALKKRKILCYQFIDLWVNYSRRFQVIDGKQSYCLYPDKVLTLDEYAAQAMVEEGIPENLIEIIGQPYFEYQHANLKTSVRPKLPNLTLLITQPVSRYYGKQLGYDEEGFIRACLSNWQALEQDWRLLHVIVHPAEDKETYEKILKDYSEEIQIVVKEDFNLRNYSLVLGMFSSLMVQSLMAGIPTASVQPGGTDQDQCFLSKCNYIPRLTKLDELYEFLKSFYFNNKSNRAANLFARSFAGSCQRLEALLLNN